MYKIFGHLLCITLSAISAYMLRHFKQIAPYGDNLELMSKPIFWKKEKKNTLECILFVLRFYGPVNPMGSCRAQSVYLTTRLLGRLSPLKRLTSIVHILLPETDNCPFWISGRERMTVENISWSISTKELCRPRRGLNPRPPGLQSDGASNWATEAGCF